MAQPNCPICYGPLEVCDTSPCYDCGTVAEELEHLVQGRHTYAEVRIFGVDIILCDFCQVDFSSYDPTFFGRPRDVRPGADMVFVRDVLNPVKAKDKWCPNCRRRLAFLRFLEKVRATATC